MQLDIVDLLSLDSNDSVEISSFYKGNKLCSQDRKKVLRKFEVMTFILEIPQLSVSVYFSILYWMSLDRGLHHFPVLNLKIQIQS